MVEVTHSATEVRRSGDDLGRAWDDFDDEVNRVTGGLNRLHAELVDLAAGAIADPARWKGVGIRSLEHWLCWRAGLGAATAKRVTTIARRLDDLPVTVEAFRDGRLTLDQAALVARWVPWWADEEGARLAQQCTVRQLSRVLPRYPFDDLPKPDEAEADEADTETPEEQEPDPERTGRNTEYCRFWFDDKGRFHLNAVTDGLTGAIIERALVEARDALFQQGQPDVSWANALEEVAQRSLDTVESPTRRDRFKLYFHFDIEGGGADAGNARIPESIRKYLTCDGSWNPIFTKNGLPLNAGRNERIVPDRLRRIVYLRDGGQCDVPGCTQTHWLEIHHIIHWDDGGVTDTWNLVCLCPYHHRMHHRGELGIRGNADDPTGLTYTDATGSPIKNSGAAPEAGLDPGPLCPPLRTYRSPLGERLETRWLYFNPPWVQEKWRWVYPPPLDHPMRPDFEARRAAAA